MDRSPARAAGPALNLVQEEYSKDPFNRLNLNLKIIRMYFSVPNYAQVKQRYKGRCPKNLRTTPVGSSSCPI